MVLHIHPACGRGGAVHWRRPACLLQMDWAPTPLDDHRTSLLCLPPLQASACLLPCQRAFRAPTQPACSRPLRAPGRRAATAPPQRRARRAATVPKTPYNSRIPIPESAQADGLQGNKMKSLRIEADSAALVLRWPPGPRLLLTRHPADTVCGAAAAITVETGLRYLLGAWWYC